MRVEKGELFTERVMVTSGIGGRVMGTRRRPSYRRTVGSPPLVWSSPGNLVIITFIPCPTRQDGIALIEAFLSAKSAGPARHCEKFLKAYK